MHMLSDTETLNIKICCLRVKHFPVLLNALFVILADIYFCLFYLSVFSTHVSKLAAFVLGVMNNFIAFMILISLMRAATIDPGSVPLELKIRRSDIVIKHHKKKKEIMEKIQAGVDPMSINYLSDEDRPIENSQETENLEQDHESNKVNEESYNNSNSQNKSNERKRFLALSRFEK